MERLQKVVTQFEQITGEKIVIHETFRSQDRQDELYSIGRTKPGMEVTKTKESLHSLGLAVDVIGDRDPQKKGIQDPYGINWKLFGQLVDYAGLNWGGKWGDKVHVELKGPYAKSELFEIAKTQGLLYTWLKLEEYFEAVSEGNKT
jgi:hypothetical protein